MPDREDWKQIAEDRGQWLDTATRAIADAWAALGFNASSAPNMTLAEVIRQRIARSEKHHA